MSAPESLMIDDVRYIREDSVPKAPKLGPLSIVRTRSAGVHIGILTHQDETTVTLVRARRLWQWYGAFTLNAVATNGVDRAKSRISVEVPTIVLTEAIEIIRVCDGVDLSSTEK